MLYSLYLLVITLVLLEVILRIYNPFNFRVKNGRILLQANKQFIFHNNEIPVLDSIIIHTKNELGMRGPKKPDHLPDYLSIITVGGSTTECGYISDGRTWSDHLYNSLQQDFNKVWLNNAGYAGHSTFGHTVLLEDYLVKLQPAVIVFLVGCNDVVIDDFRPSDQSNLKGYYASVFTFFTKNSELCSVLSNLWRTRVAHEHNLNDTYLNLAEHPDDNMVLPDTVTQRRLQQVEQRIPAYKNRLQHMIDICNQHHILPVFITQPALYGRGIDSITGANLETLQRDDSTSAALWWQQLKLYNNCTKAVAAANQTLLIDLANELPKSSLYFYDYVHYGYEGNKKVSEIVYKHLKPYLTTHFSSHQKP